MTLPSNLEFLASPRFWSMVIAAVTLYLQQRNIISDPEAILIGTISAGFWTTQTIDRLGEHVGRTEVDAKEEIKEEKRIEGE